MDGKYPEWMFPLIFLGTVFSILALTLAVSLVVNAQENQETKFDPVWYYQSYTQGVGYISLFDIEDMPCIVYHGDRRGGIDCDWSQWKGVK